VTLYRVEDAASGLYVWASKREVWQWLKAERQYQDKVRQWLRAEGVKPGVLMDRRMGRPEAPLHNNRAARRSRLRAFRRLRRLQRIT